MKKILVFIFLILVIQVRAQITLIPDPGFESFLLSQGIDSDGEINGQVLTSDIEIVTELYLTEPFHTVTDLTGLEDFAALEHFEVWSQDITTIDLSNNFNLIFLNLGNVLLEVLNIENNINLTELRISTPFTLSSLDLSHNLNIEIVRITGTLLTEIDMSYHIALRDFGIFGNHDLLYVNLQNGNNENVLTRVEINFSNENVICVQVDDPQAVIDGIPPYEFWEIDESITISDDCGVFSVEDFELFSLITVYPNPVKDVINIENNSVYTINSIQIYDVLGRLVLVEKGDVNQKDVSHLNSGVLFVKIETNQGVITKKIIKE